MNGTIDRSATIEKVGDHAITITRDFDAPVDKVFRAMHDPELIAQWVGPRRFTDQEATQVNEHGGTWTLVQRDDEGNEFGFRGVIHGTPTPELSIRTFEWLGMPGHVFMETMRLEDLGDGRTRVHGISVINTKDERDGMFDSGMDVGVNEGYARLDDVLERL